MIIEENFPHVKFLFIFHSISETAQSDTRIMAQAEIEFINSFMKSLMFVIRFYMT